MALECFKHCCDYCRLPHGRRCGLVGGCWVDSGWGADGIGVEVSVGYWGVSGVLTGV
jgi:hypothetical protein